MSDIGALFIVSLIALGALIAGTVLSIYSVRFLLEVGVSSITTTYALCASNLTNSTNGTVHSNIVCPPP